MPILDGYQATKIIKNHAALLGNTIKVIGFTAVLNEEEICNCKECGMDSYLSKPPSESLLFKIIM